MKDWKLIYIVAVLCLVVIVQGIMLYRQRSYVTREDVKQLVYDIMESKQNRDDDVAWAQLQWVARLHIKRHPKDEKYLLPYSNYWKARGLDLWDKWEGEK